VAQLFEPPVSEIANIIKKIYIVRFDVGAMTKTSIAAEPDIVVVASTIFFGNLSASHPKHK
jgi:hypothetical protein